MKRKFDGTKLKSVLLKTAIVESILLSCMKESSFSDIHAYLQRAILTTETVSKEYLYHLINGSFVIYNGKRKRYLIDDNGKDLLNIIYVQRRSIAGDYRDFTIEVKYRN